MEFWSVGRKISGGRGVDYGKFHEEGGDYGKFREIFASSLIMQFVSKKFAKVTLSPSRELSTCISSRNHGKLRETGEIGFPTLKKGKSGSVGRVVPTQI